MRFRFRERIHNEVCLMRKNQKKAEVHYTLFNLDVIIFAHKIDDDYKYSIQKVMDTNLKSKAATHDGGKQVTYRIVEMKYK